MLYVYYGVDRDETMETHAGLQPDMFGSSNLSLFIALYNGSKNTFCNLKTCF